MTGEVTEAKDTLRATVLAARGRLSATERAEAGASIRDHGATAWRDLGTVAAYLNVGTEPPTAPLLDALFAAGVHVLLPVIIGDRLDWAGYAGPDSLAAGPLGILEPTGARFGPAALTAADLVVVPALAVDRHGHRLGRGRGYYDRALTDVTAPVIAVGYDDELVDDVPVEPHDRSVTGVLRPSGLVSLAPR